VVVTPRKILLTGAGGFIGHALRAHWRENGVAFVGAVRDIDPSDAHGDELIALGDMARADWAQALTGIDTVVHLAARTHVLREHHPDPEAAFRIANVELTRQLAQAAVVAGVRRLVFASSVKVNGEATPRHHAFTVRDAAAPEDAYGRSKWAAEQQLAAIARAAPLEVVILRLPLVYGPGVKGNFLSLLRWIARERPLPFKSVDNRRSLLYVGNLVTAIDVACQNPAAAGKTYLLADADPVSTPELCRRIAAALGVRARVFGCPVAVLRALGALAGRHGAIARLTGSLVVDASAIGHELGWTPPYSMHEGLAATAAWLRAQGQSPV
jgi:nucleoside-diphosphate-sugar epimerase